MGRKKPTTRDEESEPAGGGKSKKKFLIDNVASDSKVGDDLGEVGADNQEEEILAVKFSGEKKSSKKENVGDDTPSDTVEQGQHGVDSVEPPAGEEEAEEEGPVVSVTSKKKKKKKKEKEKKASTSAVEETAEETKNEINSKVAGKKVPKHIREMQEKLAKMKEAEERKKREEEERLRKEEEEMLKQEELERLAEEKRRLKKEREKEKLLKKKQEGKLLTGKQKEEARRLEAMRKQILAIASLDLSAGESLGADLCTRRKNQSHKTSLMEQQQFQKKSIKMLCRSWILLNQKMLRKLSL